MTTSFSQQDASHYAAIRSSQHAQVWCCHAQACCLHAWQGCVVSVHGTGVLYPCMARLCCLCAWAWCCLRAYMGTMLSAAGAPANHH